MECCLIPYSFVENVAMENGILGLHHITAIASEPKRNLYFYTQTLGMRLVKKTVNFDDPGTYHFYFGDRIGTPGTILTFFPWAGAAPGRTGTGMATHIGYSIPPGSMPFWKSRLEEEKVSFHEQEIMGKSWLTFRDPDGLQLQFVESQEDPGTLPWVTADIQNQVALQGFYNVTLTVQHAESTARVLTDILGFQPEQKEGVRTRFRTTTVTGANRVDLIALHGVQSGINAAGTNHHVAFRVKDEATLMRYREKVLNAGLHVTPKIDRDYFFSLYFREPGGVLFEIATDNPGFMRDEPVELLGTELKLPAQFESSRAEIEKVLPELD